MAVILGIVKQSLILLCLIYYFLIMSQDSEIIRISQCNILFMVLSAGLLDACPGIPRFCRTQNVIVSTYPFLC